MSFFVRKWHHFHVVYFCPQVWFLLMSLFRRKFVFIFFHRHFRESKVWNGGSYCCTRHRQFRTHTHTHALAHASTHIHTLKSLKTNDEQTNRHTLQYTRLYTPAHGYCIRGGAANACVRSGYCSQCCPHPLSFFPLPLCLVDGVHTTSSYKKNS